jgi:hypothetical protein
VYACLGRSHQGAEFEFRVCQNKRTCKVRQERSVCQKEGKRGVSEKWGSCEIEWNGDRKWNEGETRMYGIYMRRSVITTTMVAI